LVIYILITVFSCTEEKTERKIWESDIKRDTTTKNGLINNYYIKSGKLAEAGRVKNGKKDSTWRFYSYNEYLTKTGNYSSGKEYGEWLRFNADSLIIEKSNYVNGILEGKYFEFYDNGKIKMKANYKEGKLHGEFLEYFENGNVKLKGKYITGLKEGKFKQFSENGILIEKANYKLDKLNSYLISYFDNGLVAEKMEYKNGLKHGIWIEYDFIPKNKKHYKSQEGYYMNGMKNGLFKYHDFYYDIKNKTLGSKLVLTGTEIFKDDKLHGKYTEYDAKEGFIVIETNYVNGIEHGVRKSYCPHGPDKGKLYIVQKIVNGQVHKGKYYCDCPYPRN